MASDASSETTSSSGFSSRKWGLAVVLLVFFSYLTWFVINPYRDQPYEEIPHGDHIHYVPKDRNENVSISRFPTRAPDAGQRITPDGEIVPDRQ